MSTDIAVADGGDLTVPDWMLEDREMGKEGLDKHIIPPRLKAIQKQANSELLARFDVHDFVAMPQGIVIAHALKGENGKPITPSVGQPVSEKFTFIPLFTYDEYLSINPREITDQPMIAARSFDEKGDIARKAANQDTRREPYPGKPGLFITHLQAINFIVVVEGVEGVGDMPVLMTFSKGSHRDGSNLAALLKMRKAAIFANRFQGVLTFRKNEKGEYSAPAVSNPSGVPPYVLEKDRYDELKKLHIAFREAHEKGLIQANYDDDAPAKPGEDDSPGEF